MKIIIIGCNGYIGQNLSYFFKNKNYKIFGYDVHDKMKNNILKNDITYITLDISIMHECLKINWDVDFVFFFSGLTGTKDSVINPRSYFEINEIGLTNILKSISVQEHRPRIIFPSTRLIYKGSNLPLKENDAYDAKTIYALNKLTCENILKIYQNLFSINYTIIRICIPYASLLQTEFSYGTIGFMINQAKSGSIILFGDGSHKRTFTHIDHLVNCIYKITLSQDTVNQIYNIGGEVYSLYDVAKQISYKYNTKIKFEKWPEFDFKIESGSTFFDSQKLEKDINYINIFNINDWIMNIKL